MKKLLCLLMAMLVVLSFAACGGDDKGDTNSTASNAGPAAATSIKFDAESYEVGVDAYLMISEHVTVEPAGAKVVYESSDEEIAELVSVKGEFYGVKTGEVTVTAKSEDGKVVATAKLVVQGFGTVVARDDETNVGGITNKRWGAVERPDDSEAYIVIIPKGLSGADMSKAVALDAGEKATDGSCAVAVNGYYIAKTGDTGNYVLENIPEGDYVGIIISSMDYTSRKQYDVNTALATFKSSAIGSYFSEAETNDFVQKFFNREFHVGEFSVSANTKTVFGYDFQPDLDQ